jgi:hypothetical protein
MLRNKTVKIFSFSVSILFISLASSCIEEPLYLDSKQLKMVDTLAKNQILPLRRELDSLCDLHFNKEVEKAKDSIIIVRFGEINKRLGQ